MQLKRSPQSVLQALASGALALPGLAHGDTPETRWTGDYGYSLYSEDKVPASKLAAGSRRRYAIDTHQFRLEGPLSGRLGMGLDFAYESMSGATPWYVEEDADGKPIQVMSGATIEEERVDTQLRGSYYFDNARAGAGAGFSLENDYTAVNGALEGETHFFEKNSTLGAGLGFSYDMLEPTDAQDFDRPQSETKQSLSAFAAWSQVLGRSSTLQTSLAYQHQRGYLSDPYKLVSAGVDGNVRDDRPEQRNQVTWLTRYRKHFSATGSTLHLDYRFYVDDWEINSHTLELAIHQAIWEAFRIVPSLRYYSQSAADFYGPFFDAAPAGPASSDYRLSPFGAFSWRIKGETRLRGWPFGMDWSASVAYERYISSGDLALGKVSVASPGLVSFDLVSVGLGGRF